MHILILIFVNALTHVPTTSAHVIPFPSSAECAVAGAKYADYEAGVEAGKTAPGGTPDTVYWYCVPVMAPTVPTT